MSFAHSVLETRKKHIQRDEKTGKHRDLLVDLVF